MEIFRRHGVSYILKCTNANSITHAISDKEAKAPLLDELRAKYEQVTVVPSAIVCVIGTNMAIPGVLTRATQILADAGVNVNCVSQSYNQVNMQFVIERDDYKMAVVALNQALCLSNANGAALH